MKKCTNCFTELGDKNKYKIKMDNAPLANIIITKKGIAPKIIAFLCPKCGKIELYVQENI